MILVRTVVLVPLAVFAAFQIGLEAVVTLILFFLILGVSVLVHELGHFVVARLAGVRVLEFGFGFPPRAKVIGRRGDTVYTLNWLPIGGFVKLEGEDGDSTDSRSFTRQRLPLKILILVAGVIMNLLLAFVIFTGITLTGDPAIGVVVPYVQPGSPAETAGIQADDVIERIDGKLFDVFEGGSPLEALRDKAGQPVTLQVLHADGSRAVVEPTLRPDDFKSVQIAGRIDEFSELASGALGIGGGPTGASITIRTINDRITYPLGTAIAKGLDRTVSATKLVVGGVAQLVSDLVSRPTQAPGASGPVGIATQIGAVFWALGPIVTLYLAGILSANLAVVNILPFPPLDGGRILILVLKRVLGTRLSLRAERLSYVVGALVLFAFIIWVTAFDVARGFGGGR